MNSFKQVYEKCLDLGMFFRRNDLCGQSTVDALLINYIIILVVIILHNFFYHTERK